MWHGRRTAVLELSHSAETPLPLDRDRRYDAALRIDDVSVTCERFRSPLGDEAWRDAVSVIRFCTTKRAREFRRRADEAAAAGHELFKALCALSPALERFLDADDPRRLVIASSRPEIHALPWEAMTDQAFKSPATKDLSIVRCAGAFDTKPQAARRLLRIVTQVGPDTNQDVPEAVASVGVSTIDGRPAGVAIVDTFDAADIVNVVAHGDRKSGEILLAEDTRVDPKQLAARVRGRLMVLVWSCHSGMMQSWGESAAMELHNAGNTFVLGFSAPLHFDEAKGLANRFYQAVFGASGSQDPESEITALRRLQFEGGFEFCEWASMMLWLKCPVDLTEVPLGRLRLPASNWTGGSADDVAKALRDAIDKAAALGEVQVVSGVDVAGPLPSDLVREWRGAAVHLVAHADFETPNHLAPLGIAGPKPGEHLADRVLALLDRLAQYPFALLLWTRATASDALFIHTLDPLPRNVAVVLASGRQLPSWPEGDGSAGMAEPVLDGEAGFIRLVMSDRFREAGAMSTAENATSVEYWSCRYLLAVKTAQTREQLTDAWVPIRRLETLDPLEATLLAGNLHSRLGGRSEARARYQEVVDKAVEQQRYRELARGRQELAWLAQEMGERGRAEQLYRSAIDLLQDRVDAQDRDTRWTSALARAIRDYADLLAGDGRTDALPLLRRATAIHAIEGRVTQVAYCLVTRSRLRLRLGDVDAAETDAQQAAVIFNAHGNDDGWVWAIICVARAAGADGRYDQARAILERSVRSVRLKDKQFLRATLLVERAAVALAAGDLVAAHETAAQALADADKLRTRDRAAAERIRAFIATLK